MSRVTTGIVVAALSSLVQVAFSQDVLPPCVCQPVWTDASGTCEDSPKQRFGCPTLDELRECDTSFSPTRVRWCKTTSSRCAEQLQSTEQDRLTYCDVTEPTKRSVLKTALDKSAPESRCMTVARNQNKTEVFDLRPLQKKSDPTGPLLRSNWQAKKVHKEGHDDRVYYMNICDTLVDSGNIDPQASVYEEVIQNEAEGNPHVMGKFENTTLVSIHEGDLRMVMPDGIGSNHNTSNEQCPHRETVIMFFCDQPTTEKNALGSPVFVDEFNTCQYVFVWNSCAACPLGHKWRDPSVCNANPLVESSDDGTSICISIMSPVSALFITLGVCIGIYLVLGISYNRLILGARGFEQLPNYKFWSATCTNICAAPAYIGKAIGGKPKVNSYSVHNGGLLDDSDDDDVDDDAENHEYS